MNNTQLLLRAAPNDTRPIHFIGIAGAGMSALAELFKRRGVAVQGTDSNPFAAPDLVKLGITVSAHDAAMVKHARAVSIHPRFPRSIQKWWQPGHLDYRWFVARKHSPRP